MNMRGKEKRRFKVCPCFVSNYLSELPLREERAIISGQVLYDYITAFSQQLSSRTIIFSLKVGKLTFRVIKYLAKGNSGN